MSIWKKHTRFLRTSLIVRIISLFRPLPSPISARQGPHPNSLLLLLMAFVNAPVAHGECWSIGAGGSQYFIFAPVPDEYSRSVSEGTERRYQNCVRVAESYLPNYPSCSFAGCNLNNLATLPNGAYYRTFGCGWSCLVGGVRQIVGGGGSMSIIPVSDVFCSSSHVIKLSNDVNAPASGDLAEIEPGKVTTTLRAKVYDNNNQPVPNVKVKLEVTVEASSGGHLHDNSRPRGLLSNGAQVGIEITGMTGGDGMHFTFSAPAPTGDHKIKATCLDRDCAQEGPDKVWVGIKNLDPLLSSSVYVLLPNRDTAHPANHYMTSLASQRLAVLAALYHGRFPNDPLLHLNDASLERGGLFDYKARIGSPWAPPHETHRDGRAIDIRANSESGAIPVTNFAEFIRIARRTGGSAGVHSPGTSNQHFHVTF